MRCAPVGGAWVKALPEGARGLQCLGLGVLYSIGVFLRCKIMIWDIIADVAVFDSLVNMVPAETFAVRSQLQVSQWLRALLESFRV